MIKRTRGQRQMNMYRYRSLASRVHRRCSGHGRGRGHGCSRDGSRGLSRSDGRSRSRGIRGEIAVHPLRARLLPAGNLPRSCRLLAVNVLLPTTIITTLTERRRLRRKRAQPRVRRPGGLASPRPLSSSSSISGRCNASALCWQRLTSAANLDPKSAAVLAGWVSADATRQLTRPSRVLAACHLQRHTATTVSRGARTGGVRDRERRCRPRPIGCPLATASAAAGPRGRAVAASLQKPNLGAPQTVAVVALVAPAAAATANLLRSYMSVIRSTMLSTLLPIIPLITH